MNKKLIMGAAAGLVLGLGGGTAYVVMMKPAAPPPAAHVAADSLAADSSAHALASDSTHRGGTDSAGPTAGTVAHATADADGAKATPATQTDSVPKTVTQPQARTAAVVPDSTSLRLGRIFGAMKPEDAAAVLSKLEDAEVKAVLFQLSDRKAAEILARFPGERAANLTKTLLTDARAH